jgi:hypothetical protein
VVDEPVDQLALGWGKVVGDRHGLLRDGAGIVAATYG